MNPKENFERKQQAMKPRSSRKAPPGQGKKKKGARGGKGRGKERAGGKRGERAVASNETDHGCSLRLRC